MLGWGSAWVGFCWNGILLEWDSAGMGFCMGGFLLEWDSACVGLMLKLGLCWFLTLSLPLSLVCFQELLAWGWLWSA